MTNLQTDKYLINATLTVYNLFGQQVKQIKNISGQSSPAGKATLMQNQKSQIPTARQHGVLRTFLRISLRSVKGTRLRQHGIYF